LDFLRSLGADFARSHPDSVQFLGREDDDPDIKRLLEGFAFLTGRIRQKLDDEFPELTYSLFTLLWPHLLRPIPAMSILQFRPIPNMVSEKKPIPKGTRIDSVPVVDTEEGHGALERKGTRCQFRTTQDVDVYPFDITDIEINRLGS